MSRGVSRIALIAYLVGGWLLPAAHWHADHAHSIAQFRDVTATADPSCGRCSCHCEQPTEADATVDSPQVAANERSLHDCLGICALCAARVLVSDANSKQSSPFAGSVELQASCGSDPMLSSGDPGMVSARGPPRSV